MSQEIDRFISPTYGILSFDQVIEKIADFIKSDSDFMHTVVVGTDSKPATPNKDVDFVTVVLVHRKNKGGIYFYRHVQKSNIYSLQQRIGEEVALSLELAVILREKFSHNGLSQYQPEIHVDVGEHGATRELIKMVRGMVIGSGFTVKTKPDSYGASKVADKHTHA